MKRVEMHHQANYGRMSSGILSPEHIDIVVTLHRFSLEQEDEAVLSGLAYQLQKDGRE